MYSPAKTATPHSIGVCTDEAAPLSTASGALIH
jgi:hypothetical protein